VKRQRHSDRVHGVNERLRTPNERLRSRTVAVPCTRGPGWWLMTTGSRSAEDLAEMTNPIKNAAAAARIYRDPPPWFETPS